MAEIVSISGFSKTLVSSYSHTLRNESRVMSLRTQRQFYALPRAAVADGVFRLKCMHVSEACARWRKPTVNHLQPDNTVFAIWDSEP